MAVGVYVHVPFCKRKCPYCDFYSVVGDESAVDAYVCALLSKISASADKSIFADTLYFGGGTPSLLSPAQVSSIISAVKDSFTLADDSEITMECNPSSADLSKLLGYREAGVNRLSFGVQSADDKELEKLGRLHDFELAKQAVSDAQKTGFVNISCDLMIGTPNQTVDSLSRSVRNIVSLGVTHMSCYMLKIEEGTAYDCDDIRASVADDDTVSDMYLALVNQLDELGYKQYEISNFAKLGCESRHNTKYWIGEDYLGFGPSAHSYFAGKRTYCDLSVSEFVADPLVPDEIEDACPDELVEYVMLGLRLTDGVSFEKISKLGGDAVAVQEAMVPFIRAGYSKTDGYKLWLTPEGFLRSNGIISRLIDASVGEK